MASKTATAVPTNSTTPLPPIGGPVIPREDWAFEELQDEAEDLRSRLNRFRKSLGRFFVKKQELIDLMLVAAIAQEPLLLVGPPGTAKSDLVLKFKDALGLNDTDYFEYMLTRFTEPSEIIGPIDIGQLREGRYIRREQGKLPTARLGFLDEIFKSNSAILNILLTIINERKFYQDGVPQPVQGNYFTQLVDAGLQGEVYKGLSQKPWCESHASLDDILKANRYLTFMFGRRHRSGRSEEQNDRQVYFPAEVFDEFQRLIKTLVREDHIFISD